MFFTFIRAVIDGVMIITPTKPSTYKSTELERVILTTAILNDMNTFTLQTAARFKIIT